MLASCFYDDWRLFKRMSNLNSRHFGSFRRILLVNELDPDFLQGRFYAKFYVFRSKIVPCIVFTENTRIFLTNRMFVISRFIIDIDIYFDTAQQRRSKKREKSV